LRQRPPPPFASARPRLRQLSCPSDAVVVVGCWAGDLMVVVVEDGIVQSGIVTGNVDIRGEDGEQTRGDVDGNVNILTEDAPDFSRTCVNKLSQKHPNARPQNRGSR